LGLLSRWPIIFHTGCLGLLLAGCVTPDQGPGLQVAQADVSSLIREVDLTPRSPTRLSGGEGGDRATGKPVPSVYYGSDSPSPDAALNSVKPVSATSSRAESTGSLTHEGDKAYELNFENTPIPTAAKAVLGDILGLSYVIDPRVQGTVTLSSGRAVPRKDLLYSFESALRVGNVALVKDGAGYRLMPSADAVGTGAVDRGANPDAGFGVSVVPLQYVSASVLTKLIENFAAKPGMVRPDSARNLLLIQGNASDRRTAIDTALNFDADWMRGQSVGIYPIVNSTPEPVVAELERILDSGEGGLSQNVVKLQPVTRQNAVLAVARTPQLLKRVSTWIERLDKAGGAGSGFKVYRMRYGDARSAAALLNSIFLGNSNSADSPGSQIAPGSGLVSSSSDRLKSGFPQQGASGQANVAGAGGATASPTSFGARFASVSTPGASAQLAGAGYQDAANANGSSIVSSGKSDPILSNVRIAADVANNALLIYANNENYHIIQHALQQIDRPQLQVAIDATIAEVSINDNLRYGVQAYLSSKDVGLGTNKGSVVNSALNAGTNALLNRVLPGFNFLLGTEAEPRLILDALRAVTQVKVLSTPSLVVLDNQYASLQVGDQIPITTRTAQAVDVATAPVVNNIDYRNTGVILRVAPRINANGNVLLKVEQEISNVANTNSANTLTPTVSERRVESSISVANGQTVLLGGLMSERRQMERDSVPGVEQVPVVSELFSHRDGVTQRTELIIFIRPQIIRNGVDAYRVAEELRAKMRGFVPAHRGPPLPPIHK
jgi:general secretion pathway protein D